MSDKKFTKGFFFSRGDKAPDYVVGTLSINADEAIDFIKANSKNGKLKISILNSKAGKPYMVVDEYEPKGASVAQTTRGSYEDDDLPF